MLSSAAVETSDKPILCALLCQADLVACCQHNWPTVDTANLLTNFVCTVVPGGPYSLLSTQLAYS
jgi:hypothetical protein